jgi:hypothetical protein
MYTVSSLKSTLNNGKRLNATNFPGKKKVTRLKKQKKNTQHAIQLLHLLCSHGDTAQAELNYLGSVR